MPPNPLPRKIRYRGLGAVLALLVGAATVLFAVDAVGDLAGFVWRWVVLLPSTLGERYVVVAEIEALLTAAWWVFWFAVDALVVASLVELVRGARVPVEEE